MKFSLLALAAVLTSILTAQTASAFAGGREETKVYLITVNEQVHNDASAFKQCVKEVRGIFKKEGGQMNVLEMIGVITGDLTPRGASLVKELRCVAAVEEDQIVHANPRTGRSN
ncbi:MAG: hypothetical protein ACXWQO_13610 [Bdellovibrionota bacterium]